MVGPPTLILLSCCSTIPLSNKKNNLTDDGELYVKDILIKALPNRK